MKKLIVFLGIAVLIFAAWAGIMWCIWTLWCGVLQQVYPSGAPGLIAPGFWLFAGVWTLLGLIGRSIFGSKSSK